MSSNLSLHILCLQISLTDETIITINKNGVFKVIKDELTGSTSTIRISIPNVINGVVVRKQGAFILATVAGQYRAIADKTR